MRYSIVANAFLVCSLCWIPAQAELPSPQWIWAGRDRDDNQAAFLRKSFTIHKDVTSAQLVAAADFNQMALYGNGQRVAVIEDYGPSERIDVTQTIRAGDNLIGVMALGSEGPSAVAVRLELTFQDGTQQNILTDSTWQTSRSQRSGWQQPKFKANGWQPAVEFGSVGQIRISDPKSDVRIEAADDYTQWKQALDAEKSANPSTFRIPQGFEIELLRSAGTDEGSWVSLAFDPDGRLIIAKETRGLLRLTLPKGRSAPGQMQIELVNDSLEECRGLLFAHGCLYANANNSKGLYRLRDSNGDDQWDDISLLYHSPGGVGHGRNDLALGPDGMIYSIHGDAVDLPSGIFDRTSPFREHRRGVRSREGHVIRTDRNGASRELMAAGLRNPFGIDFNPDGEMFTYDADAEFDMGAPWYRPTRVHHVLPGGDYGWRGVTKQWPPYYPDHPDAAPPNLDIGKGSPTAVRFGTHSNFPPKYRRALFILDWAYGRILCVHMTPRGASYAMRAETFARGRPMNVTDLIFGPDGAMYFVTGGRGTRSGLYRIRYTGPTIAENPATAQQLARAKHATQQRAVRRRLESLTLHSKKFDSVPMAWPFLDSPDPWLRHAARIAIEHQPIERWEERVFAETKTMGSLTALMALAGSGESRVQSRILAKLRELPFHELSTSQKLIALRTYELCFERVGRPDQATVVGIAEQLERYYPDEVPVVNRELSKLLAQLDSPTFVDKTMGLLKAASDQAEQLHYLFVLRTAQRGWTPELRRTYFEYFGMTKQFTTGEGMEGFIGQIKDDALAATPESQREEMKSILAVQLSASEDQQPVSVNRPFVREWELEELLGSLSSVGQGRDLKRGKRMFTEALCAGCHRLGSQGRAVGPDLTAVSHRFGRRDLLKAIIAPSEVVAEQYRQDVIETADGRVLVGSLVLGGDYRSPHLKLSTDPFAPVKVVDLAKSEIVSHTKSAVSQMPEGLLNTLSKDEILDLLAYIEAAGEPGLSSLQP